MTDIKDSTYDIIFRVILTALAGMVSYLFDAPAWGVLLAVMLMWNHCLSIDYFKALGLLIVKKR